MPFRIEVLIYSLTKVLLNTSFLNFRVESFYHGFDVLILCFHFSVFLLVWSISVPLVLSDFSCGQIKGQFLRIVMWTLEKVCISSVSMTYSWTNVEHIHLVNYVLWPGILGCILSTFMS